MIVKNESKIILRLLNSVVDLIDSWCICDTGSTDNTKEIITDFFKEKGKPGKLIHEPFRDFGYNRSVALAACKEMPNADYILLLDADMIFKITDSMSKITIKSLLKYDAYFIFQGSEQFFYKNVRIVKNNMGFNYWGVTHEYIQSPEHAVYANFERDVLFINDIGDGGSKTDKADRDIRLLLKGLEELPNNDRYTFYLANTYKDKGDYVNAIETYKKRIKLGGWIEEIWQSYYCIGKCYKRLGDNTNAIYYWLEAYACFPKRIENLYEIIQHYRIEGKNNLAYHFYLLADYERKQNKEWDYLFLQKDVYDYKIDYELSIIGYYCNRDNFDLKNTCMKVLANNGADDAICKNIFSNYKFYTDELIKHSIPLPDEFTDILKDIGKNIVKDKDFISSTPSICMDTQDNLIVCVRYVNYTIDDNGGYVNKEFIETKNIVAKINKGILNWTKTDEFLLGYNESYDNLYVGLEDVRIMSIGDNVYFNANRGVGSYAKPEMVIEHGMIDFKDEKTGNSVFLKYNGQFNIEKNWVLFESNGNMKCVYKWYPLTIGDVVKNEFKLTNEINTPNFFGYMRGSTNGVIVGNEIWFLTHLVSYEDRRNYYHCMVILDKNTFRLKKYTPLFTFEKNKVEYTLGFVYMDNRFLIGYSVFDKETKYMMISKHIFDDMCINA
jgi:tetratricopeptide (TPR) repeat protein